MKAQTPVGRSRTLPAANRCVTLWIGKELGPIERACLMSVLRQGHELALYCYREPSGVPDGVEIRDAGEVLRKEELFFIRDGSVASFSDWFRYELLARGLGTWVDTDMYLLKPLDSSSAIILGEQQPGVINNAVLRLPPDSPMLRSLIEIFKRRKTPHWIGWRPYLASRIHELVHGSADLSQWPWGATGPMAVTALAKKCGISALALPSYVLYPVPWNRADWIVDPAARLESVTDDRTVAVHLWNECIKEFKSRPAPAGTFLHRLHKEGAI